MNIEPHEGTARVSRKQWMAIAVVLVMGLVAAALILRGGDAHEDEGPGHGDGHVHEQGRHEQGEHEDHGEGHALHMDDAPARIALTDAQIKASAIAVETSASAVIQARLQLPGEIRFNDDRTAHVVPRVSGVVDSVAASLGQRVKKGQVLAVISSAGLSEQRSSLRAAQQRLVLARSTYERERQLWEEKISPQQDVQQARQALREAEIAVANEQQQLGAIGAGRGGDALGRYELRAPFDGLVVEKHLTLGEMVKEDANVFTISDLSTVWAEVNIGAKDLDRVRVGERVVVRSTASATEADGVVSYVGSLIGEQTRTAKARITLLNPELAWRPGLFVDVEVLAAESAVAVAVLPDAVQTVDGASVVFVRVEGGFEVRPVRTGRADRRRTEIVSGLKAGTPYAAAGSFVLKSEHGKGAAAHEH